MPRRKNIENLDEQITQHYYTAKQAQQKLGMDRDKFNYTIKTRKIQRVPFLGGYGYYKKAEIDELADEIEAFLIAGGQIDLRYQIAKLEDLDAILDLVALNFGRKRAEATREAREAFLKACPEMTHCLYRYDHMVASIDLIPFTHDAILEFRTGIRGWQLGIERIRPFEPGQPLECIIIDMMTTTRVASDIRKWYAAHLLKNFRKITMTEWAKQGIRLATIDACAGTEDGKNMLEHAGFTFLGRPNDRPMYHIEVEQSDLPLLRHYKSALEAKEK